MGNRHNVTAHYAIITFAVAFMAVYQSLDYINTTLPASLCSHYFKIGHRKQ